MKYSRIPIVVYHDISNIDNLWCVPPAEFEAQVQFLAENGYQTITLDELQEGILKDKETTKKLVAITFDDARKGVYQHAFPLLKKYGFTAAVFAVPAWIDGKDIPAAERYSEFMSWKELKELQAAGFIIGSHSYSHRNLTKLTAADRRQDLELAEKALQEKLGVAVRHFTYPFGKWNKELAEELGKRYSVVFSMERGFSKNPGAYARQAVLRKTSLEEFASLLLPPKLSLCMCVKNEEQFLGQCLSSVQGLADEIVIVDTGSSDTTKEIASRFTSNVFDVPWQDDFAAARNESLKHATGDWILVLDADEVLAQEDCAAVRSAIADAHSQGIEAFRILTRNYSNDSSRSGWQPAAPDDAFRCSFAGWYPSSKVRLFRNLPGICFEGRVHELVEYSLQKQGKGIAGLPVVVHHYGALRGTRKEKLLWHRSLAQKKAAENPSDAKAHYELGILYKETGKLADAEEAFHHSRQFDPSSFAVLLELATVEQKQGKLVQAIQHFREVLAGKDSMGKSKASAGKLADAHFGLGYCLFIQGKLAASLVQFQAAMQCNSSFVEAYVNAGAVAEKLGKLAEAERFLRKALSLAPSHARAHYNLGVVYEKAAAGKPAAWTQALQCYEKALALGYPKKELLQERVEKIREMPGC